MVGWICGLDRENKVNLSVNIFTHTGSCKIDEKG